MQKFGNIPVTGVIDNATIGLLRRKRCGLPDLIRSSDEYSHKGTRPKRYALQGLKWKRTNLSWR
ncbi:Matrix metalloproteinase-17-like protein [Dinothrombium tinctorium]|uniref:Matrix metalloproteinase-17-like protein n=1 Tax=Dinothrombium tinctorium TaxID=1965070 RepID=A0A443RR11_9ACAR|nr:Matrix metalloproteinase-17-like protein [Dinothrombium tinctorium]